jgi:hypothetical protein
VQANIICPSTRPALPVDPAEYATRRLKGVDAHDPSYYVASVAISAFTYHISSFMGTRAFWTQRALQHH